MSTNQQNPPGLQQLKQQLKTLKDKCQLQNKKIKLYRKENEQIKHELARQAQTDASLLLNSKELSEANSKLEGAIHDISMKLQIELDSGIVTSQIRSTRPVAITTIKNITVTEQTEQVDLPNQGVEDEDIAQLTNFRSIKSLLLGENKIGNTGVIKITTQLTNVVKLQLNSNSFDAEALKGISNLHELKVLDIRNNKLGDSCMPYLAQIKNLTELSISKNGITDKGISEITGLVQLTYLDLTTNAISDEGVTHLLAFKKLTHLYLMSNRVTEKRVPEFYEALDKLEVLDLRFNINDSGIKENLKANKPAKLQLFC